jgi:hypothetical protein
MCAEWFPLALSATDASLPPLLVSATFTADSYKIYLTDLTCIWSESLNREQICDRARVEDTVIEPQISDVQFQLFLDKIRLGLSGKASASIIMSAKSYKRNAEVLNPTKIDLQFVIPVGMDDPLEWTIRLLPLPQSAFMAHVTVPLLNAQAERLRELESLVELLKNKDHVITKLVDKIYVAGADLSQIFPGLAIKSGKKITREFAEPKVKGLKEFEKRAWVQGMKQLENEEDNSDIKTMLGRAFPSDEVLPLKDIKAVPPKNWEKWWEHLKGPVLLRTEDLDAVGKGKSQSQASKTISDNSEKKDGPKSEEPEFQVQATPPVLVRKSRSPPTTKASKAIEDSTEDEDDLEAPSQRSAIPDSYAPAKQPNRPRKLGGLSGLKTTPGPAPKSPTPELPSHNLRNSHHDEDETATEDEDGNISSSSKGLAARSKDRPPNPTKHTPSPSPSTPPQPTKMPRRLGGLRGAQKSKEEPPASPEPESSKAQDEPSPPKPKRLGGLRSHRAKATDEEDIVRGRSVSKEAEAEAEEEKPRETSLERANRRREERKRELEAKASAPKKKARRF